MNSLEILGLQTEGRLFLKSGFATSEKMEILLHGMLATLKLSLITADTEISGIPMAMGLIARSASTASGFMLIQPAKASS